MNKTISILAVLLLSIATVSAWHCEETQIGADGWHSQYYNPAPVGCVGNEWYGTCTDQCIGETYKDFYCVKRFPNLPRNIETVIAWVEYPQDEQCIPPNPNVPEFTTIGAGIALLGIGYVVAKNKK